ncbi:histidine phosphatase family protein [Aquirhabdus sp.]|uniref:histidine phosphatase family protein n=1 Tax=Aquirhabdus sp. TaxID=2824160 RepID=UPI00396CDF86
MPKIYLIRHGHAQTSNLGEKNPALDSVGDQQAIEIVRDLDGLDPCPIWTSPLRRCRQTAAPLAYRWLATPIIEPSVTEVPSPMQDPVIRSAWLMQMLTMSWPEMANAGEQLRAGYADSLKDWREKMLYAILSCREDTVIYSHFFVINALIAHATQEDRVVCAMLDYGSITVFDVEHHRLRLDRIGRQMVSHLH